jgi:TolB protein
MHPSHLFLFTVCGFICLLHIELCAQIPGAKIGVFDQLTDIGSPGSAGAVAYSEPSQAYRLTGSGANMWEDHDSFSCVWKKMDGDFIIQTRIRFLSEGHEPHRKTGIMVRSTTAPNSAVVCCTIHGDGLTSLQYRSAAGAVMKEIKFSVAGPDVIQLEKKGTTYTMSVAHAGEIYQSQTLDHMELGSDLFAGLFVCSHNNSFSEEVEFTNTRIFNTAPDDLVQYKTYLGSLLEVMDVATGHRQVVGSSDGSWQAPNWTPDGKTLIYNADGLLYTFDIATRVSKVLNTGFAIHNNNDHVLTFDGTEIGMSHHAAESGGGSVVYTMPVGGGVPKRVTEKSPSYFHGWSPDKQFLLYTGERSGDFDIYKISRDGGQEVRLTTTKGLDDGSEYSPDGKYIYFCSTRTGTMQVWRMDPDGRNQTQLTFDDLNNWFPHVSPDNKSLVFISFPKEIPADQHPFYQRVYLRVMSVEGGPVRTIAYVYGGQGSMNVPSWSPDSHKIAFVSNGIFPK